MQEEYFLVWNPQTGFTRHKHKFEIDASREAKRLAQNNIGNEFIVLKSVRRFKAVDILEETFKETDDIPF